MYNKKENGITMVALIITIIAMLIIAGITIKFGKDSIKEGKVESIKTNMLLIEAKAKQYVENASFDLGIKPEEATEDMINKALSELKGTMLTNNSLLTDMKINVDLEEEKVNKIYYYQLSTDDLNSMGLKQVDSDDKNGFFLIRYDIANANVEVYSTVGIEIEGIRYYSLSDLRNIE